MSQYTFQITVGDRATPLTAVLKDDGKDYDLSAATVTFDMYGPGTATTQVITAGSCTAEPGITFTANATTDEFTANAHGMENGDIVVVSNSGGALPSGLVAGTRYAIINRTENTFQLSLKSTGEAVAITTAGTGTQTIKVKGLVQYSWAADDVDAAGRFRGWFKRTVGSTFDRFPNDDLGIAIEIKAVG